MYEELVEPFKCYLKKEGSKYPVINKDSVLEKYGEEILVQVKPILDESLKSTAYRLYDGSDKSWDLMEKAFAIDFNSKFPLCCKEIYDLCLWYYSFLVWKNGVV